MAVDYSRETATLTAAVVTLSSSKGEEFLKAMDAAAGLLTVWTHHFSQWSPSLATQVLMPGVQAGIVEAAGCVSLGLTRPALFSMRAQIDMALAWLYFKDHSVEWRLAQRHAGEGKLRAEVVKYLGVFFPRFKDRYKLLVEHKTRRTAEPYQLLSAHVHSVTSATVPSLSELATLVGPDSRCVECVTIQADVSEYLSDVFAAVFADNWVDLPESARKQVAERLSAPQLREFAQR